MSLSDAGGAPSLAIVIPTYNRRDVLRRCLHAIASQSREADIEVLVVDDGSSDGTAAMLSEEQRGFPVPLTCLRQENSGPATARNRAIRQTAAELILIINDDTILQPGCIAEHVRAHVAQPAPEVAVLGRVTIDPDLPPSTFSRLHLDATFTTFQNSQELDWRAFITCNISVKREFLLAFGLFQDGLFPHEDLELGERLQHTGLRVMYRPKALGYHHHALTEADFFRAALRDGRALAQWYRKSPHLEPLLFDMGLQGAPPLRMTTRNRLSQAVISRVGMAAPSRIARMIAPVSGAAARYLYLKLYQQLRRSAIAGEMASGTAEGA